mmetsp:Transcript_45627/g.67288  ORF Transcript_45627/g.67288 Transcript_45627/m.67288 type:complete len:312 (-) Transcript_45627:60-995(-)
MESTKKGGAPAAAGADAVETASITHLPTMELPYFDSVEGVDLHTVFHEHSGCFVVRNVFTPELMDRLNTWTEKHLKATENDGNSRHPKQKDKRLINDVIERMCEDDPEMLLEIFNHPTMTHCWDALLGYGRFGAATIHWIEAGGWRQDAHVDYPCHVQSGPYWRDDPQMLRRKFTKYQLNHVLPFFSVQTLVACDAMNAFNGSTEVIPGSHRIEDVDVKILDPKFSAAAEPRFINADLKQGDVLFFNRRLVHRGGHNQSTKRRNALIFQNVWLFGVGQHEFDQEHIRKHITDEEFLERISCPYPINTRNKT